MIFGIAETTGWTIDYIVWNLSAQQIVLLGAASEEIHSNKDEDKANHLENMSDNERDKQISNIFGGVPIMEG